jgi:hypothetical protein
MNSGVNQYKGLNLDTSYDSINGGYYIDALDIRVSTTKGESQGAITNRKGNSLFFDLGTLPSSIPIIGVREIIGTASIRNTIVLFVTDDSYLSAAGSGWVLTLEYNESNNSFSALTEIYAKTNLVFSKEWPIKALGRFESGTIQKVYWTDYNNYLRAINIVDPNVNTYPPELIDIFPNIIYTQPLLTAVQSAGGLLTGMYQYAFRLITSDGKQTLISPPSNLIHTSNSSEVATDINKYSGNASGVNSGKSHQITINTSDYSDFESIELISVFHDSFTGTPIVQSVETKGIGGASSIIFLHTGNEGSAIDLELFTYTTKQYAFKTCKTLAQEDNSLLVANIKGSYFDIDELLGNGETFDSRTARHNSSGDLPYPLTGTPTQIDEKKLKNAFNNSVDAVAYPLLNKPDLGYNMDAHWDVEWHTDKQFKYKSNGTTLGGEGSNIFYEFHLEQYKIDSGIIPNYHTLPPGTPSTHNLDDGYTYVNNSFDNNGSPFVSGLLKGYKRGETYRFGIVFYNKKGEASFVQYIGDIKFPDISDKNDVDTIPGILDYYPVAYELIPANTYAYSLGVKFTVDFSTCPTLLSEITGYQIVRLDRTNDDTRRLCSGIIRTAWKPEIGTLNPPTSGSYDLKEFGGDGSEDMVHLFSIHSKNDPAGIQEFALGCNGNFALLNNKSVNGNPFDIWGSFLTFYSPEISYQFGDSISLTSGSYLLITGRYSEYYSENSKESFLDNSASDSAYYEEIGATAATTEALGDNFGDFRRKLRSTKTVEKELAIAPYATHERGVEYLKRWEENAHVLFEQNLQDDAVMTNELGIAIGKYNGFDELGNSVSYYFRNFYTHLGNEFIHSLNDHNLPNLLNVDNSTEFFKGASGITGTIKQVETDPILATPLAVTSSTPSFDSGKFTSLTYPGNILGPVACPTFADGLISTPILDIFIPRSEIYGGYTQNALENNVFIPASPFIKKPSIGTSDTFIVFGGDIFIDMWTFQDGSAWLWDKFYQNAVHQDQIFNSNRTSTITMPIETKVNLPLAWGATVQRGVKKTVNGGPSGILDEKWRQETNNTETTYGKSLNMYLNTYNEVYSIESNDVPFFIKPKAFDANSNVNDIRAYLSNVKINQEKTDSWTQFGINNYYDVDDYGPINEIVNWRNYIWFFQDSAVGKYSINPRAIVSPQDGIPTELGSGLGIQDHVYISEEHGATHQWGVEVTNSGIYYFDSLHKKIFVLGEGNSPLSEIKGIHSFLNAFDSGVLLRKENGGDNPILGKGVHVAKDKVNDEIIFTFLDTSSTDTINKTLIYDELMGEFVSFYSGNSPIYIENNNILLSVNPSNKEEIYLEHSGDWGEIYGNTEEAYIKLVLNEAADVNKILRFVEFNSIVRDNNKVIDRTQTITGFRVQTEYQDTGKITDLGRIKRRFDKWRLKIPRNSLSTKEDRLRSTHFVLTLYFDNSYNKELILNRILHFFNVQMY